MNKKILFASMGLVVLLACNEQYLADDAGVAELKSGNGKNFESVTFTQSGSVDIGNAGAAEISAFDPSTNKLFVVNNDGDSKIDVVDLSDPANLVFIESIDISAYGSGVNSVDVKNGLLAAAIEASIKTDNGKVVVFETLGYSVIASVEVGALPDMVTFTPDGRYILSANEGEPNDAYTVDPVGTVSIINVTKGFSVNTLDFSGFESQQTKLKSEGFRIFGKNASFAQDIEPEYITVSENSKKAWVSLQENNAIAEIDINSQTIVKILPLGFKDYSLQQNSIDPSNEDGGVNFGTWPVYGMYQPDGIAVLANNNVPFVFTANEGDSRAYKGFSEEVRIGNNAVVLDAVVFPNAVFLKQKENLGRLNITNTLGDIDGDGDYDKLYSYGARSFSIWHGLTGKQIYDSGDFLDKTAVLEGSYDDARSDDKGVEPEAVVTGRVGNKNLLFVGMERADAVAIYDVTNPVKPKYLQWLKCGDAPEGIIFIPAEESPVGKSLLVVSSENDGVVNVFITI
jgi:DNA-binding beta-propeller fold protein YncE